MSEGGALDMVCSLSEAILTYDDKKCRINLPQFFSFFEFYSRNIYTLLRRDCREE